MKICCSRLKPYVLALTPGLSVFLFHARYLTGEDPSNFVLAIKYGYSIDQDRPHPPGYSGFYLLWKGLEWVTGFTPQVILLTTNALFATAACLLTYFLARRFFGEKVAWIASLLVLTNPMLLYFTNTTEMYAYDAAFSAFLVVMLLSPSGRIQTLLFFAYGLAGAFRTSSIVLTFPFVIAMLLIRAYKMRDARPFATNMLAFGLGWIAWCVPFVIAIGGWSRFEGIALWTISLSIPTFAENLSTVGPFVFWSLNVILLLLFWNYRTIWNKIKKGDDRFLAIMLLAIGPALFFMFRYYTKGYALLCLVPIAILAAQVIAEQTRRRSLTSIAITLNLLIFFGLPFHAPPPQSTFSHRLRTNAQRWQSALFRSVSWYEPTYAHLRASDAAANEANALVDSVYRVDSHAYIVVDPPTSIWIYPRCFATIYPKITFLTPMEGDSSLLFRFRRDSQDFTYTWSECWNDLQNKSVFYYLTDRQLIREIVPPPGHSFLVSGHLALFSVPVDSFDALKQYDHTFFY